MSAATLRFPLSHTLHPSAHPQPLCRRGRTPNCSARSLNLVPSAAPLHSLPTALPQVGLPRAHVAPYAPDNAYPHPFSPSRHSAGAAGSACSPNQKAWSLHCQQRPFCPPPPLALGFLSRLRDARRATKRHTFTPCSPSRHSEGAAGPSRAVCKAPTKRHSPCTVSSAPLFPPHCTA